MNQYIPFDSTLSTEAAKEIKIALKPDYDKLPEAEKEKAKLLAVGMVLGNKEATEEFHKNFLIWFPLPIPPLPPIIWEVPTPVVGPASVAVGLILIGIGIMLL